MIFLFVLQMYHGQASVEIPTPAFTYEASPGQCLKADLSTVESERIFVG